MAITVVFLSPLPRAQDKDPNWVLTFADEFNSSELDLAHWVPHDPWEETRDRQLQSWSLDSLKIGGGQLHLTAQRNNLRYVSGIVTTFGTFAQMYGRFEIRCKIPTGRGLRSLFSLYPAALSTLPEIDIFELSGSAPSTVSFANQWGTEQTQRSFGDSFPGPDFSTGFHTVAIEWDPDKIVWFIDGKKTFQSVDGVPRQPMFLLLDLAVGGGSGSAVSRTPNDSTKFPASFDIDYVHVYRASRTVKYPSGRIGS